MSCVRAISDNRNAHENDGANDNHTADFDNDGYNVTNISKSIPFSEQTIDNSKSPMVKDLLSVVLFTDT